MRILFITPFYYPATYWGGPIYSLYGRNGAIAAMPDVQLKVLTTDAAGPKKEDRLEIHTVDCDTLFPNYAVGFCRRDAGHSASLELLLKLPALIRWSDVVHLAFIYSFPTIPTLLLSRIWHKPLVWSLHGALLRDQKFPKAQRRNLKRLWMGICNAMVQSHRVTLHVTSEEEKSASAARIPNAKVRVIRHCVETPATLPEREYLPEGRMRLLFLGRLDPVKGLENLLEAMKQIDDPSITLSICGDGDAQYVSSLKQYIRRLGLLDNYVHFLGQVDGIFKTNAFLSSDVSILPSYSENFGMAVAESLAHGVPVIVSSGTPWKSVEDRQCGLWVDNSPESLACAIRSIRQMKLADMGRRGWEWMKKDFSWASVGAEMLGIYKDG
ncbi:MAG: glycosyltransferase [Anaerolineales bacterium]|nr:glycosyltransferase [Anaerolineales bacterium]